MSKSTTFLFKPNGADVDRTWPIILGVYQEIVGILQDINLDTGSLLAEVGSIMVALPLDLEMELSPHLGERIGILRTDTLRVYRIRRVAR